MSELDSTPDAASKTGTTNSLRWVKWPEVWLFLIFSVADISLTYVLIGYYGHAEGNPVARYFVDGWGLKGMIWFKLSLAGIMLGATHMVVPHRPVTARAVVRLGLLAAAGVVVYSVALLVRAS